MTIQDVMLKTRIFLATLFIRTKRSAGLFGIITAVTGPFLLLTIGGSNLPWYAWMITLLLMLLVIGRGRYMFMLESKEAEAISISPKRR
jgi:hypothetical protein